MTPSENCFNLIKQFEGLRLTSYQDQVGVWTIGYGHTGQSVHAALTITQDCADEYLHADVSGAVDCVNREVAVDISQNQFDALVDFVFNLGCQALKGSTLLAYLNAGRDADAAGQFQRWDHAGGVEVPGLLARRQAEARLFAS